MEIITLLKEMVDRHGSDLHLRADKPAVLRIDGHLVAMDVSLTAAETQALALAMMNDQQKITFECRHEVDIAYSVERIGRFRINVFKQRGVVNLALRLIPSKIPTIKELKMPPAITKISENERGLVLVTGTTGSGKSTTLAAMIDHINSTRADNIITIEDPIEYLFEDRKSIVSQRELGFDTLNYLDAMRNVVRQDPDVIMLGEMRDLETMATAITAAQTGHLVFSTIHTVDATQTINRIIDLFPPHQQNQIRQLLADTLRAVISLRLLAHASGHGRVPAVEILVVNEHVRTLIAENNLAEIVGQMKTGNFYGMQTFNQSLIGLFQKGEIKLEDALAAATNPEDLMLTIRGIQTSTDDANDFIQRTPDNF